MRRLLLLPVILLICSTRVVTAETISLPMDGGVQVVPVVGEQEWVHFRIDVPAQIDGEDVLGWELRVTDWIGGEPQLVVRRDELPDRYGNFSGEGASLSSAGSHASFASGQQHASDEDQWTGRNPVRGTNDTEDVVLSLAMGNPLEPGSYYVGLYNRDSREECACTLRSRAIGPGMSLDVIDVTAGAEVEVSSLAPREPAYFRYVLPASVPAWRFELDLAATTPEGEGMLVLRKDFVPNSQRNDESYDAPYAVDPRAGGLTTFQTELSIEGPERATILPASGGATLPPGTYYGMLVSEGNMPAGTSGIGTGEVDFVIRNLTTPPLESLGEVPFDSPANRSATLQAGENQFFRFSVPADAASLRVRLDDIEGNPLVALRTIDDRLPRYSASDYGLSGGESGQETIYRSGTIHLVHPPAGDYALLVRSGSGSSASYSIEIETQGATPLIVDGGVPAVATIGPQQWKYYLLDLPATIGGQDLLGWELRVRDWTGGDPQLVLRRDLPPNRTGNYSGSGGFLSRPGSRSTMDSGQQHFSEDDQWTGRDASSSGASDTEDRILSLAMGNPLEPGVYYVGVFNGDSVQDCAFTFESRAIGEGMSLGVTDVALGASLAVGALGPREPAYFRYILPSAVPSWRVELGFGAATPDGEGMLVLRKDFVPNSQRDDGAVDPPYELDRSGGGVITSQTELGIEGEERVTILPGAGETMVPAGTYFAMVVSEGNSPQSSDRIGSGDVDFVVQTEAPQAVVDLGTLAGSSMLVGGGTLSRGGAALFHYEVTDSSWPLEIQLMPLDGNSSIAYLRTSDDLLPGPFLNYGVVGGATPLASLESGEVYTLANPRVGRHALTVQPRNPVDSGAEFEISVAPRLPAPLGFSSQQVGGPANSTSFDLLDGQYQFYRVDVPEEVDGRSFLGWVLKVEVSSGIVKVGAKPESYPVSLENPLESLLDGLGVLLGAGDRFIYLGNPFRVDPPPTSHPLTPGPWIVQVEASGAASGVLSSDAVFASPLNVDAALDSSGGTHEVTGQVADGERRFYQVEVPAALDGEAILGWNLELDGLSGEAEIRVSPDRLPITAGAEVRRSTDGALLLEGPQIAPGTYYVEVGGESDTEYTLRSSAVTAADLRRTWTMPARGELPTTAGLAAPFFGDSGTDAAGNPLPGDRGTGLAAGQTHFYVMAIPEGNEGLLNVRLDAMAGNPDLYIRNEGLFTGNNEDYRLTQDADVEEANWVAADGFYEKQLPPGTHYLSVVAAGGAAARYRLQLSTGNIQDLPLNGGSIANQVISADEWQYFRVEVPLDLPEAWLLGFSAPEDRKVRVYLRDSVPPGVPFGGSLVSWADDRKNQGSYGDYLIPDSLELSTPQLRPGHTYYIGVNAVADSTYSLASQASGAIRAEPVVVDFLGGSLSDTLAAGEKRHFRVPVPVGASRWKHEATHSSEIDVYLEQGSYPSETSSDDRRWVGRTNSNLNLALNATSNPWPWVDGESYYFTVINNGSMSEGFTLTMDGRTADTDDEDEDGIPDPWERDNLDTTVRNAAYDGGDNDGIALILEYFFGLDPNQPDQPEISAARDGDEFILEFWKTARTPLVDYRIARSKDLEQPAPWADALPVMEVVSDDGERQLMRARIPVLNDDDVEFFRIEVP